MKITTVKVWLVEVVKYNWRISKFKLTTNLAS